MCTGTTHHGDGQGPASSSSSLHFVRRGLMLILFLGAFFPAWLVTRGGLISSVILATSFALGPTLREMLESLVLLLHIRPFDVGDKVVFHGTFLRVVQIRLMSAVFHNAAHTVTVLRVLRALGGRTLVNPLPLFS